jgi:hypothetical protein
MAIDWFVVASKEYMLRAGWSGADDEARMFTWLPSLEKLCVSKAEFDTASQRMQESGFPLARANHLASLLAQVKALRESERERTNADRARSTEACLTCGGSGLVAVPHPRHFNKDGQWAGGYMCSAVCGCPAGDKWNSVQVVRGGYPVLPLTLERYEREVCANWREWLDWWAAEKDKRDRARHTPKPQSAIEINPFKKALKQAVGK